jgi:hypothetical protein
MDNRKVEEIADVYRKQIQNLDSESLKSIAEDHSKALEYVKKGIELTNWDKSLTEENIEAIANEMQLVAQMVLKERVN